MLVCTKCGAQLANDSIFCDKCGTRLQQPTPVPEQSPPTKKPERLCNTCSTAQAELVFCDNCGYRVEDPRENFALQGTTPVPPQLNPGQFQLDIERTPSYVGAAVPYTVTVNGRTLETLANGGKVKIVLDQPQMDINVSPSSQIFRFSLVTPNLRLRLNAKEQLVRLALAPNFIGRIEFQVQGADVLDSQRYQ